MPPRLAPLAAFVLALCSCGDRPSVPDGSGDAGTWGTVHCTASENVPLPNGGCKRTFTGCSDGHFYAIECAATTCTCRIDGTATGRPKYVTCDGDGLTGVALNCEWATH